jgi:hypothetical protein
VIHIDVLKAKTGCTPDCDLSIDEDAGTAIHNRKRIAVDTARCMEPGYDGPGWLTLLMAQIHAGRHR